MQEVRCQRRNKTLSGIKELNDLVGLHGLIGHEDIRVMGCTGGAPKAR